MGQLKMVGPKGQEREMCLAATVSLQGWLLPMEDNHVRHRCPVPLQGRGLHCPLPLPVLGRGIAVLGCFVFCWVPPACPGAGAVPPQGQDLALLLVERHEAAVILGVAFACHGPSGRLHDPLLHQLCHTVSSANVLREHSSPSFRSLMKMLKRTGLGTDPWDR